jgi:CheY-like chemotaxis protein
MKRMSQEHVLRQQQNEVLTVLTDTIQSDLDVSRKQTEILLGKVGRIKQRRQVVQQKLNGLMPIRILVADPDEQMLDIVRKLGSVNGTSFDIQRASSKVEMQNLLSKSRFDVVLLSCQSLTVCSICASPGKGISALIKSIKKIDKNAAIIAYAKEDQPTNHDCDLAAMNAGASDFLSSDELIPKKLEKAIRYAIRRK